MRHVSSLSSWCVRSFTEPDCTSMVANVYVGQLLAMFHVFKLPAAFDIIAHSSLFKNNFHCSLTGIGCNGQINHKSPAALNCENWLRFLHSRLFALRGTLRFCSWCSTVQYLHLTCDLHCIFFPSLPLPTAVRRKHTMLLFLHLVILPRCFSHDERELSQHLARCILSTH